MAKLGHPPLLFMYAGAFRYNTARKIKESQDAYCADAFAGNWDAFKDQPYPEDLQWEALVDVLRGRVKVSIVRTLFSLISDHRLGTNSLL